MRVLVSGWTGSTNLGDELVFAGIHSLLGSDAQIVAVSVAPEATTAEHGVKAIDHRRPDLIARAAQTADLVVFGGGGIVQDETSPWNLPYHLSRPLLAAINRTPWVGLDLGIGPVNGRIAQQLTGLLRNAAAITVRDEPSQALLDDLGVNSQLSADAALHLPKPSVEVEAFAGSGPDRGSITVSLRPWQPSTSRRTRWLPVGWRDVQEEPAWFVPTVATALDRAAERTGLPVRFVAMQTDRDRELHERVAAAMETPARLVVPTCSTVLDELAAARIVVAMRYHAGIGATLAGRPSVLVGYSPKVDTLAATLGEGAAHRPFSRDGLTDLDTAIAAQLESVTAVTATVEARERLRARTAVDHEILEPFRQA